MTDDRRLLQINPDPIRLVPAAQRDVWTRTVHRWRCEYEDGRGRCTSRDTELYMVEPTTARGLLRTPRDQGGTP